MKAPGQGIVVLGSQRRVVDLLEKKAANYSDRPVVPTLEMYVGSMSCWWLTLMCFCEPILRMGLGWSFALMRYGAVWRQHRRAFHKYFSSNAIPAWHPIMYEEIKAFLRKAKSHPDAVSDHVQMCVEQVHWSAFFS